MDHRILIAVASRHGSTEGIARRIATTLEDTGVRTTVLPVDEVRDVDGYDGYVIGSAVYALHWLGEAKRFVHRHRAVLRAHPVWLFSSGPLATEPDPADEGAPRDVPDLVREIDARDHRIFAGAWHRDVRPIGVMERVMSVMPAARDALPEGDFRDWEAIDQYARSIAGELELALTPA